MNHNLKVGDFVIDIHGDLSRVILIDGDLSRVILIDGDLIYTSPMTIVSDAGKTALQEGTKVWSMYASWLRKINEEEAIMFRLGATYER